MLFHDEQINVGDRVWHIRYGYLDVVEIQDAHFVASGQGKRHHITNEGVTMGAQLVFWHDPWIVIPCKNLSIWQKVVAIAMAAAQVIK